MAVSMPIFIKDYTWTQSEETIVVYVPMKVLVTDKLDLVTADKYIKAHYPPLLFEVFLADFIDDERSTCTVCEEEVVFSLQKFVKGHWDVLEADLSKKVKIELKKEILEKVTKREQENATARKNARAELGRVAVRSQINVDTKHRKMVERLKEEDKQKALKDIEFWGTTEIVQDKSIKPKEIKSSEVPNTEVIKSKPAPKKKVVKSKPVQPPQPPPVLPLPRNNSTVTISFTPRQFPTPTRESRSKEEEEWLTSQAIARRTIGFASEDLRPEERNPQFLKEKGDTFFQQKNYLGAISAYSFGIKLSKNYVALYVNRSAAHLAHGNYQRCAEDCSAALDLMKPEVPANLRMRAKCIARRGAALCKLGLLNEGAAEIRAANKLLPNDEKLKEDLEALEAKIISDL